MSARQLDPQKRSQFLNAALKLFVKKGVQNTSTAAIAQEAGTAAGTLFLYFPTKQDLINELILNITRQQAENTSARLLPEQSAQEMFLAIWNSTIRWFIDNLAAYQYVQQVRDTGWLDDQTVQTTAEYFSYFYTAIQAGLQNGEIGPYPLELIGEILYRQIVAIMNLIRANPNPAQHEVYIQSGFEIFWKGIRQ